MSLSLIPLLLAVTTQGDALAPQLQQCRAEASPLVRLACYDAIGSGAVALAEPARQSELWQAIWRQEQGRTAQSEPFLLGQDAETDAEQASLLLTRPALRGATLAISCSNSITSLRLRLDEPWVGNRVETRLDDALRQGNWFVREQGMLLEYGRGLPAIDELKGWVGHRQLTLTAPKGVMLQFDLTGLGKALSPLRQQCRW
ncbi:type VI secretion system-associated protein VasI [Aeromonas rivuli]|jgi:type VI secretion system protein VasI|uniref:type VI secretion system-associated protein VasI n=1 Tax=Aeromonas TaxID=642 RepID=UPI0005A8079A|nr:MULTISPECIES: type VI secretion system-associated protein VasI [Aeromonas]MCS3455792.1 type VI secretion system protein VasI [Aeromonas sp. BIGb0405]MCS3458905.1 type VI secretion system protein VasI [Aeromonas sp. BIGb0445]